MADEPVRTALRRIDHRPDTNQPTGHRKLQLILLCVERDDATKDRSAADAALRVPVDDTGSYLDAHAEREDAGEDGATGDAALELVDLCTGFVHVERTNDDEPWGGGEVADGNWDAFDNVLVHGVDVVFQLG